MHMDKRVSWKSLLLGAIVALAIWIPSKKLWDKGIEKEEEVSYKVIEVNNCEILICKGEVKGYFAATVLRCK